MKRAPSFEEAVTLFNQGQFFECHEVLEDLWRPLSTGPEKTFLQGLLQVGVGFHHLKKLNYTGARNLLASGLEKLEAVQNQRFYKPPIILSSLITAIQEALGTLLTLGLENINHFPDTLIPKLRLS